MVFEVIFWLSVGLIVYTFLGYQLLIGMLAQTRRRVSAPAEPLADSVAVVLVACDEAERIERRVRNLLATPAAVEVWVCSDGSGDETVARAQSAGAKTIEYSTRRGKAACLSDVIPSLNASIVVLTDARQEFTENTVPQLAGHFSDPTVGAVSGILRIGSPNTSTGEGVDLYWKMETRIRRAEAKVDSCVGCTGAVYAIRRSLFQPIPADTILDDVVIPMQIAMRGYRVLYDDSAEAFDPQPLDPTAETRRKSRTLASNFQMLFRYPHWLLPWRNRLALQLVSHKYLRLTGPALLLAAVLSSAALFSQPLYRVVFGLQVALYLFAMIGLTMPSISSRLFSIPAGFVFLNVMTLRGLWRFLFGDRSGAWDKGSGLQKKSV